MSNSQGKPENGNPQRLGGFLRALGAKATPSELLQILSDSLDLKAKQTKIKDIEDQVLQRRTYFNLSIFVGISWLVFTTFVICANGLETKPFDFYLFDFSVSDKIVITLIGSSSIPSLALVGKYLFNRSKD